MLLVQVPAGITMVSVEPGTVQNVGHNIHETPGLVVEQPENLLLKCMRRFDAHQARFEDALCDMLARVSSIEGYLVTMHGDLARHRGGIEMLVGLTCLYLNG